MFVFLRKKIGIIGYGNMGSAIAERIKRKYCVFVFDKDKEKTKKLEGTDIRVTDSVINLVEQSDVVIIAVKPQDFDAALNGIKDCVKRKLIISIAAGIRTAYIEKALSEARVIRVMPNIAAKIGEAESAITKGNSASHRDLYFAQKLFNYLGKTWVMAEDMIDAATAISGSGPAYIFYDMEKRGINPSNISQEIINDYSGRLTEAAQRLGFALSQAQELSWSTTNSSIHLAEVSGMSLGELKVKITSPGGTTEAALKVLDNNGSWTDAALAAKKRATELSRG